MEGSLGNIRVTKSAHRAERPNVCKLTHMGARCCCVDIHNVCVYVCVRACVVCVCVL